MDNLEFGWETQGALSACIHKPLPHGAESLAQGRYLRRVVGEYGDPLTVVLQRGLLAAEPEDTDQVGVVMDPCNDDPR